MSKVNNKDKVEFEDIPFEEQIEIVKKAPFQERADLILRSQYPQKIISEMGPENFYIIARSTERELLPEFISYATTEQLVFYTDFQCFEFDRISRLKFTQWISLLLEASHEKFLEWVNEMDFDFIVTGYKKIIRIIKSTPEEVMDEILQDEEYFTIDFLYYICIKDPEDFNTIKTSIELIFEYNKPLYINLMECVIGEILAETEEQAYLSREERLSQSGFPDKDSAMKIYTPITREEWLSLEKKQESDYNLSSENTIFSDVSFLAPTLFKNESLFIDELLLLIAQKDPKLKSEIDVETMSIANKIIVLSMPKTYDLDETRLTYALKETKGTLNISLGLLTNYNLNESYKIFKHYWLEYIFRRGFTEIAALRKKANSIIKKFKPSNIEIFYKFLDVEYESTLRGMLMLSPKIYDSQITDNLYGLREFRTIEDLQIANQRLETTNSMMSILINIKDFNELFLSSVKYSKQPEDLTFENVIFTTFANFVLHKKISAYPINKKHFIEFFEKAFTTKNNKNKLKEKLKKQFINELNKTHQLDNYVYKLIEKVFDNAQYEFEKLNIKKGIDARFIHSLYFKK